MKTKSKPPFAHHSRLRRKRQKKRIAVAAIVGCGLLVGAIALVTKTINWLELSWHSSQQSGQISPGSNSVTVFSLASKPTAQRAAELQAIAQGPNSLERSRARYLLATDLIQQRQGLKALSLLDGLEPEYPVLDPYIALKRAQATDMIGDKAKSMAAWQNLLDNYSDSPVVAEALLALGKTNPKDWEQVIAKFPSHPRLMEIARSWLQQNPQQPQLLLLLTKYAFDAPGITSVLDQLVNLAATGQTRGVVLLKPNDWEAIARGYWENRQYGPASNAYAKAPRTPQNAYLFARGLQLSSQSAAAIQAYRQMVQDFPKSTEAAIALLQIVKTEPGSEIVTDLDHALNQFPNRVGDALQVEVAVVNRLKSDSSAAAARQLLLTKYGHSTAAAEYRWQMAQAQAEKGDLAAAFQWAQPIMTQNPNSEPARQAGFWAGKWASRLGKQQLAKAAWAQVLAQYPRSYYAWRSAVSLGCNVGDFTTVSRFVPKVVLPAERPVLPSGSAALQELYQLGQDGDAWTLWQTQFQNRLHPTVTEQFTDGLLRQKVNDYVTGIAQVSKLEDRDTPFEQAQYNSLKQQPAYWQALYPLPFAEPIQTWSTKRQLNPLLVTALIRQESQFMPHLRSKAGAVGLMQVMPEMANAGAKHLHLRSYDLYSPNDNVNLGTWLLDSTSQQYKNNSLLAVASYNAGGGRVAKWRRELGLSDPDRFVEAIPFAETRFYVKQIFGNYWNYLRLYNPQVGQQVSKCLAAPPLRP